MNDNPTAKTPVRGALALIGVFARHELLFLVWGLMEIALIAPFALAIMPWSRFWPVAHFTLWLLLLMLVPFNLSRLMSALSLPVDRQRLIMVGGLLLAVLLAWRGLIYKPVSLLSFGWLAEVFRHAGDSSSPDWPRDVITFFLITFMWWRGIALAGRSVDIGDVGLRFRLGALIAAPLVAGISGSLLDRPVAPFVLLFLLASLVAIVLTRVEQLELTRSGHAFPLTTRWILGVLASASLVVFITGVASGILSGETVFAVVGFFGPLWLALAFGANVVLATISFLSLPVLIIFSWFMNFLVSALSATMGDALDMFDPLRTLPVIPTRPEDLVESGRPASTLPRQLIAILTMVFVVLLISLALRRLFRLMRRPVAEAGEEINPLEGLGGLRRPGLAERLLNRLGFLDRWRAAASVRRIYREMSQTAAFNGYPRVSSETPLEYLKTLAEAWPENLSDTRLITEAYNRVRYGEIPETRDELDEILNTWSRLEKVKPAGAEATSDIEFSVKRRVNEADQRRS